MTTVTTTSNMLSLTEQRMTIAGATLPSPRFGARRRWAPTRAQRNAAGSPSDSAGVLGQHRTQGRRWHHGHATA